jgi:hypothetical protein
MSYLASQKEKEAATALEKAASMDSKNKDIYYHLETSGSNKTILKVLSIAYRQSDHSGANDEVIFNNRGKAKLTVGDAKGIDCRFRSCVGAEKRL